MKQTRMNKKYVTDFGLAFSESPFQYVYPLILGNAISKTVVHTVYFINSFSTTEMQLDHDTGDKNYESKSSIKSRHEVDLAFQPWGAQLIS